MKKLSIFSALLVGAFLFAACDADRDDNPVLDLTKTQDPITMNTPTFAGGFYDLQNTDTIFFACTAPNYGFPATVTYALEVSIVYRRGYEQPHPTHHHLLEERYGCG